MSMTHVLDPEQRSARRRQFRSKSVPVAVLELTAAGAVLLGGAASDGIGAVVKQTSHLAKRVTYAVRVGVNAFREG